MVRPLPHIPITTAPPRPRQVGKGSAMSMHKKPLTPLEESGLRAHGLDIGTPSQLSDVFRQGIAWAQQHQGSTHAAAPDSCMWVVTKGDRRICQPPKNYGAPVAPGNWIKERMAVEHAALMRDPVAIKCLIHYHEFQESASESVEHGLGKGHTDRIVELREIGRAIIAEDPECWEDQPAAMREFGFQVPEPPITKSRGEGSPR